MVVERCGRMAIVLGAALWLGAATAGEVEWAACSFLSGKGTGQKVAGARIQSNGTIVLAANLAPDGPKGKADRSLEGGGNGAVVLLSPDGRTVLAVVRVAAEVKDLAIDAKDNLYVAAGEAGVLKLDPAASKIVARLSIGARCDRVDAASDGHCAGAMGEGTGGQLAVFDPEAKPLGAFKGHHKTYDACIDGATKTVVFCGFRQTRAAGNPVQIAYLRATDYAGKEKWTAYDWSSDKDSDRYLNKPTNNMADTRGYRVAIGGDGQLYAAFESAGGNHIFRYSPFDIMQKVAIVGGDQFHSWHNTRAEHKTFFAKYDPATGRYLQGQQICGRLSSGRGNTVRVADGAIEADDKGVVYLAGTSASGLPLTYTPPGTGDYTGGGYLLIMSADFRQRLYCTRVQPGSNVCAVGLRRTPEGTLIALGGEALPNGEFPPVNAIQPKPAQPSDDKKAREGFFAVLRAK